MASAAMTPTSDESMPPDSPNTTSVKPFFSDVVAGGEHQRVVHLVDRREQRVGSTGGRGVAGVVGDGAGHGHDRQRRGGVAAARVEQAGAEHRADVEVDDVDEPRRAARERCTRSPWSSTTNEPPSKISSSWPPTWFT